MMTSTHGFRSATALGPVAPPSFVRITEIELRKAVDYRAGRWILGVIVGLGVLALLWLVWTTWHAPAGTVSLQDFTDAAITPAALLLPVLGILAMTSEWTQRTALTTFTLSPRRIPVLLAKLVAALLLTGVVLAALIAATLLATVLAGLLSGDPISWTGRAFAPYWGGLFVAQGLFVLMGAGFGALIPITGVALVAFFVAPVLFAIVANTVLSHVGAWFDVFRAFGRLGEFKLDGKGWESLTSILVWVVVPIVVGLFLSNRREVK